MTNAAVTAFFTGLPRLEKHLVGCCTNILVLRIGHLRKFSPSVPSFRHRFISRRASPFARAKRRERVKLWRPRVGPIVSWKISRFVSVSRYFVTRVQQMTTTTTNMLRVYLFNCPPNFCPSEVCEDGTLVFAKQVYKTSHWSISLLHLRIYAFFSSLFSFLQFLTLRLFHKFPRVE